MNIQKILNYFQPIITIKNNKNNHLTWNNNIRYKHKNYNLNILFFIFPLNFLNRFIIIELLILLIRKKVDEITIEQII